MHAWHVTSRVNIEARRQRKKAEIMNDLDKRERLRLEESKDSEHYRLNAQSEQKGLYLVFRLGKFKLE